MLYICVCVYIYTVLYIHVCLYIYTLCYVCVCVCIVFCMVNLKNKTQNKLLIIGIIYLCLITNSKSGCQSIITIRALLLVNVWI